MHKSGTNATHAKGAHSIWGKDKFKSNADNRQDRNINIPYPFVIVKFMITADILTGKQGKSSTGDCIYKIRPLQTVFIMQYWGGFDLLKFE